MDNNNNTMGYFTCWQFTQIIQGPSQIPPQCLFFLDMYHFSKVCTNLFFFRLVQGHKQKKKANTNGSCFNVLPKPALTALNNLKSLNSLNSLNSLYSLNQSHNWSSSSNQTNCCKSFLMDAS